MAGSAREATLPESIGEDGGGLCGGLIVGGEEVAAERGCDAEDAEEIPGDPGGGDRLRQLTAAGGDVVALPGGDEGHLRRCLGGALPFLEYAGGDGIQGVGLWLMDSLS